MNPVMDAGRTLQAAMMHQKETKAMEPEVEVTEPLSVGEALEKVRSESVFTGHPAADSSDEGDKPHEETDDDVGASDNTGTEQGEPKDPEPETSAEVKPESDDLPVKKKYASHEEAEKGAKEAERRMHEAIEEAKRMRLEVEEIRKSITAASETKQITKEEKRELDGYFKDMLAKIKDLDPEDPDYDAKLAGEWAGSIKNSVSTILSEENAKIAEQKRIEAQKATEAKQVESKVVNMATKAGLDLSSDKSADFKLFWSIAPEAVGETIDDRISWVIKNVNDVKASIVGKTIKSQEKSKEAQVKNKVLERGVSRTNTQKKEENTGPLTVMDAFERVERRI